MKHLFANLLETKVHLSEEDTKRGARLLVADGVFTMGMGSLAGGPFLAAFALAIGASRSEIGMLATIALLSQLMQFPGLALTRAFPKRRAIVTVLTGTSRVLWLFIILIPLFFVNRGMSFMLQWFLISALVGAAAGPAWNSLLRDTIPKDAFGRVFSRRMSMGMALALALTLGGGWFIDRWKVLSPDTSLYAYSCLFGLGVVLGLLGSFTVSRLPEKTMSSSPDTSLLDLVRDPVKDGNFRKLLGFVAVWSFAVNMAGPFFVIYMLDRIGISLSLITLLTVTSQLSNLLFLRVWGKIADRYSSKSVLAASAPIFLFPLLVWCFTTMPERHSLTIPLLFAIHVLSGIGLAGVNVSSAATALKLSPDQKTHGYMTVFGLVGALAGACGPMVSGMLADFFGARELSLSFNWSDPVREVSTYALNLRALDFVFVIAFVVGLYAMLRLAAVKEEGEVPRDKVVSELLDQVVLPFRMASSVEGLRNRAALPVATMLRLTRKRKERRLTNKTL